MINKFLLALIFTFTFSQAWSLEAETMEESELAMDSADLSEMSAEEQQYMDWAKGVWETLDKQTGTIQLSGTGASLEVPETFYYLNSKDAETVLVDVWGNPPGQNVIGMLFPADLTPFDPESWAVTIEYEEDGYVSDDDAEEIDYNDLLKQMKDDTKAASKERLDAGYEAIELVGWAAPPYYDQQAHKLHWAKEIKFGDSADHTLNYNIRVLGRKGVLVLNFIAGMHQKPLIDENLETVLALADFDQGSRYNDFNPEVDRIAAYGIGALVAGNVLAKTGIFAMILVLLKKFGVFIVIGIVALGRTLLGKKSNE